MLFCTFAFRRKTPQSFPTFQAGSPRAWGDQPTKRAHHLRANFLGLRCKYGSQLAQPIRDGSCASAKTADKSAKVWVHLSTFELSPVTGLSREPLRPTPRMK